MAAAADGCIKNTDGRCRQVVEHDSFPVGRPPSRRDESRHHYPREWQRAEFFRPLTPPFVSVMTRREDRSSDGVSRRRFLHDTLATAVVLTSAATIVRGGHG